MQEDDGYAELLTAAEMLSEDDPETAVSLIEIVRELKALDDTPENEKDVEWLRATAKIHVKLNDLVEAKKLSVGSQIRIAAKREAGRSTSSKKSRSSKARWVQNVALVALSCMLGAALVGLSLLLD